MAVGFQNSSQLAASNQEGGCASPLSPPPGSRRWSMEPKGFTGAPFGSQAARFDVSAIYPNRKRPNTFLQAPYSRTVCSDLNRKLGPGTYTVDYGDFGSATSFQKRLSSSSWAKSQEAARLTQMPHFQFKELCHREKLLKQKMGPGMYDFKDFLELQEKRPHSIRGLCSTGEKRFKDRIRECYPGPGTYGNPYASLQEKRPVSSLGIMDSQTPKYFSFPCTGSGLGPGTYDIKSGIDEMLKHVVSKKGPYEIFTGDRSKPIKCGHYATDKKSTELSCSKVRSFLEEMKTKEKRKHGVFGNLARFPEYPSERIVWSTIGLGPFEKHRAGPGSYDIMPIKRKEFENQPPFWVGAKRFDKKACRVFFGSANPVGVGRYNTMKHEKYPKKIRYQSLYMNETQRFLTNLERDKCLQARITPRIKSHWNNPV